MKLKDGFIVHKVEDVAMLIDLNDNFKGIVNGNETFFFVASLLKDDLSFDELTAKVLDEYDIDKETVVNDLNRIIENLKSINAIEE